MLFSVYLCFRVFNISAAVLSDISLRPSFSSGFSCGLLVKVSSFASILMLVTSGPSFTPSWFLVWPTVLADAHAPAKIAGDG